LTFTKIQKQPVLDIFTELESSNKEHCLKVGYFCEEKSFINYLIEVGINSNNEWITSNCANLLLSIKRSYIDKSKGKIFEEIIDFILNFLNETFNKISKVNATILEEKVKFIF
jgi:hypothetical protein